VALAFAGVALLAVASLPAFAQAGPPVTTGRPTDWTHHHLVFSDPGPAADEHAKENERSKGNDSHLQDVRNSTRYALHQMRRDPSRRPNVSPGGGPHVESTSTIHKDWSETLGKGLVNPNTFPAKFSFNTNAYSCTSDFIVYPTGAAGSGTTQSTILAYNELYGTSGPSGTGCGAGTSGSAVPKTYWAYNTAYPQGSTTADGSKITTSPVLSLAGDQVAFIQVNSSSVASLVLLKWATGTSVVALNTATTNVTPANYRACTAPCMTRLTLNGSPNDTWSAPFYEYYDDVLYVGDNSSKLHKFSNIFLSGTPAETTSGYPVTLSTTATDVASPIYDYTSGKVFVGNSNAVLYAVTGSTGAVAAYSKTLTSTHLHGIYDAPLVDSTAGKVYVFVEDTIAQTSGCKTAGYNCVYQFSTSFTGSGTAVGTSEPLGTGAVAGGAAGEHYFFAGTFDNIYYSSNNGTAGNLYVVGNINSTSGSLYRVPISSGGAMGTPVAVKINGTAPYPSPITEFCNNGVNACVASGTATTAGTDYIFFSAYGANETGCATAAGDGCVLAYNVSTGAPVFSSSLAESYGTAFKCFVTGGLIVDNAIPTGTQAGASEIYFIGLGGTATNLCSATGTGSATAVQSLQ
jgi:hypothetical protein